MKFIYFSQDFQLYIQLISIIFQVPSDAQKSNAGMMQLHSHFPEPDYNIKEEDLQNTKLKAEIKTQEQYYLLNISRKESDKKKACSQVCGQLRSGSLRFFYHLFV